MKVKYLFLFLILSPFFSQGQNSKPILLEGTVGRASVVMELEINGTNISAQYYYKRFKKTIFLEGTVIDSKTFKLVYEHWDSKETFVLKNMSTTTEILYIGTWQSETKSEKGSDVTEPVPVKLKRADLSKIPVKNTYVKHATDLSEYNYSRLAPILFKQDSIQKFNAEFSITWLRDTLSDFRSFRITKNTGSKEVDVINLFLEELQFSELVSFLDCQGSEYTSDVSVYIRDHVLSFSIFNSYECGGAHPDFGTTGHTFNLETGLEMELTDFLFFGKTEDDYSKADSYKLGGEIMGPNIVKVLAKLYPAEMKKPDEEEDPCDYNTPDVWDYTAWYLTEDGLYLYPYFSRAARSCDGAEFSTIPYKTLIRYKNPAKTIPMKY